jgi:hypothetical protein
VSVREVCLKYQSARSVQVSASEVCAGGKRAGGETPARQRVHRRVQTNIISSEAHRQTYQWRGLDLSVDSAKSTHITAADVERIHTAHTPPPSMSQSHGKVTGELDV